MNHCDYRKFGIALVALTFLVGSFAVVAANTGPPTFNTANVQANFDPGIAPNFDRAASWGAAITHGLASPNADPNVDTTAEGATVTDATNGFATTANTRNRAQIAPRNITWNRTILDLPATDDCTCMCIMPTVTDASGNTLTITNIQTVNRNTLSANASNHRNEVIAFLSTGPPITSLANNPTLRTHNNGGSAVSALLVAGAANNNALNMATGAAPINAS